MKCDYCNCEKEAVRFSKLANYCYNHFNLVKPYYLKKITPIAQERMRLREELLKVKVVGHEE